MVPMMLSLSCDRSASAVPACAALASLRRARAATVDAAAVLANSIRPSTPVLVMSGVDSGRPRWRRNSSPNIISVPSEAQTSAMRVPSSRAATIIGVISKMPRPLWMPPVA